jgi:hypothetical protein
MELLAMELFTVTWITAEVSAQVVVVTMRLYQVVCVSDDGE